MEKIEYEGWNDCIRLSNGTVELVALTAVGPRIIHYGLVGGPNAFHVIPETRGKTGGAEWRPYGGTRLWHAPEAIPRSYHPDNGPVEAALQGDGALRLTTPVESTSGIRKEITVTLAPHGAAARVQYRLTNHNVWPVTLAPWALTVVANGGRVVFPQEPFAPHPQAFDPGRPIVLWKFTNMADPRWRWGTRYITLRQDGGRMESQKLGLYNSLGWAAHLTDQQALIVRIDVAPGGPARLTDMGCNFETYTSGPFQELETLGPVHALESGQAATHTEYWFLAKTGPIPDDDAGLDARLLPLVEEARAETTAAFGA